MLRKITLALCFISIAVILVGYTGCWNTGTIDNSGNVGQFTSLKISSAPTWILPYSIKSVSLSYLPALTISSTGTLYVANRQGNAIYVSTKSPMGTWSNSSVGEASSPDWFDITLDNGNHVHISFRSGSALQYITNLTGSYTTETVNLLSPSYYSNIATDSLGNPHIIFYSSNSSLLMHTTTVASIWTLENVG